MNAKVKESTDTFARGLFELLEPVVMECDARIQAVFQSQNDLSAQIDSLTKELEKFVAISAQPSPALVGPIQTLIKSKQRLLTINNTLTNIKDRLDRMEKIAAIDVGVPSAAMTPSTSLLSSFLGKSATSTPPKLSPSLQTAPSSNSDNAFQQPTSPAAVTTIPPATSPQSGTPSPPVVGNSQKDASSA